MEAAGSDAREEKGVLEDDELDSPLNWEEAMGEVVLVDWKVDISDVKLMPVEDSDPGPLEESAVGSVWDGPEAVVLMLLPTITDVLDVDNGLSSLDDAWLTVVCCGPEIVGVETKVVSAPVTRLVEMGESSDRWLETCSES